MPKYSKLLTKEVPEAFLMGQTVRQLSAGYKKDPSQIESIIRSYIRKLQTEVKDICEG